MLKIICLTTLFAFGFSTLVIDSFKDISESVPKKVIDSSRIPCFIHALWHKNTEGRIKACADSCLKFGFFCNSFAVVANPSYQCRIFPTLGSVFEPSGDSGTSVIAVYERESLPTAHELSQRFSNSVSEQQFKDMSEKYGITSGWNFKNWDEITQKILKTCSAALEKYLPVAVRITDWLSPGDVASSQIRGQSKFREQVSRALESWQAWPRDPQASLKSPDLLILTFLDIFFRSLDKRVTNYDPNEKTLIVEESGEQLLIRSFGPGDFVLLFAQHEGDSPLLAVRWATYGRQRSEIDHDTLEIFKEAMKNVHHEVSSKKFDRLQGIVYDPNSHTLPLKVVFDAATLMLSNYHDKVITASYQILFQDLITAVVSSVIENGQNEIQRFRSKLLGATGSPGFKPALGDIDFITG